MKIKNKYYCYLIHTTNQTKKNYTYIGITNNLSNRLQLHNTKRGAKFTKRASNWSYHTIITNFNSKSSALQFEYAWKYKSSGLNFRMQRLIQLLIDPKWHHLKIKNKIN